MKTKRTELRIGLPSKGRLFDGSLDFLAKAGLSVYKPNPRQYEATIPALPGVLVLFQRVGDIVVSVEEGSVDFGITGWDTYRERTYNSSRSMPLLKNLGFGSCTLQVIVPESIREVRTLSDLAVYRNNLARPLRAATKFPNLTRRFLDENGLTDTKIIEAEGTLEVAPAIGYADFIIDLVSTGTTLRDNHLRMLEDGEMLRSEACLIANRAALKERPEVMALARTLLEFMEAHLRASTTVSVFANIRGESPETIADLIFEQDVIGGLQGPTISPVINREEGDWFAAHIIVQRKDLYAAIRELRSIGGSGVVVTPVTYIFEEEPVSYKNLLEQLEE
ncbi:MAG: ATP phosphoribosyltransferase [Anaerolineales bacterium]|nr:ATP phosphoribosyltransferase [Anaerolineales bacterium]